jgi:DNA repair exonuclease SbcCD ATPase subunit
MEENWKLIHEKERDLSERLKELESQKFALEQARQEKKAIGEEVEAMKREVTSLKKVKEKLFLEVQRIKVPPNAPKIQMQESMIQTEVAPGFENFDQILKKIKHLEGQCEELQEINYTKG